MSRVGARVSRLERAKRAQERTPEARQPWWWELPADLWHLGAVGISHECALAELEAARDAKGESEGDEA